VNGRGAGAAAALMTSLLAVSGGACGGEVPPPPPPGEISLALGGTADDGAGFTPLGGDVALVPGAQGGFHVWLKYRVTGSSPGPMRVRHSGARADDGRPVLVGQSRPVDVGTPDDAGAWESPSAAPAFMCPAPIGIPVDGTPIRFRVELLDVNDRPVASGQAEATPRCPRGDQEAFCVRICRG
jgi:hypothetical protein